MGSYVIPVFVFTNMITLHVYDLIIEVRK
jgi:hypothetical protein